MTRRTSNPSRYGGWFPSLLMAASLLLFAGRAHGQEALRMSLAGDVAAQSQRQATSTIGYYNLLLGPVAWRFSAGLGMDYNDNVRLQSQSSEGDFIVRPNLNGQMHWPFTQRNSFDLSLGAGYSFYTTHSELSQFYMNPGSGLSFNIYAGDCVINVHDWISITEHAYQNPSASGNGSLSRLENAAGASTVWDLNKVVTRFGYDHISDISLGSTRQVPDADSDNVFLNAGVRVLPQIMTGVESGAGLIHYNRRQTTFPQPDATQWNVGAFCRAQISQYLNARLDAGYTVYAPENTTGFTNLASSANLYFQLTVTHQVNQFLHYSLSAGRITESTFYGQPSDEYFVRLQPSWSFLRKFQLSTPLWWEKGTWLANQLYGRGAATDYDQYGLGINIGRAITKKLSGRLGYQFVREVSGRSSLNYNVNIVSLNFSYRF